MAGCQCLDTHIRPLFMPSAAVRNYITAGESKILARTTQQLAMHKDHTLLPMNLTSALMNGCKAMD